MITWEIKVSIKNIACWQYRIISYALAVFYGKVIKEKLIPGPDNDVNNNDATWEYTFKIIFKMKVSILI